jgi:hypothetical protein
MSHFNRSESITSDLFVHIYNDIQAAELENAITANMLSCGYIKESSVNGVIMFEKGNRVMRLLFGAFVKYFKFRITIGTRSQNETFAEVKKESSGMSGGLVGMNQTKNELNRLAESLKNI